MAMLLITHDLGIVRKVADDVCVMTKGQIVEAGPGQRGLRQARSMTIHAICWPPSPRASPRRWRRRAPIVLTATTSRSGSRSRPALLRRTRRHVKAVDGVDLEVTRGPHAGRGRRVRLGQDRRWASPSCASATRAASIDFDGRDIRPLSRSEMRPLRQRDADRLPGPVRLLSARACRWPRSSPKACKIHRIGASRRRSASSVIVAALQRSRPRSRNAPPLPA